VKSCALCGRPRKTHLSGQISLKRGDGIFVIEEIRDLCPNWAKPRFRGAPAGAVEKALAKTRKNIQEMLEDKAYEQSMQEFASAVERESR
jgi:hypothetical protein